MFRLCLVKKDGHFPYRSIPNDLNDNQMRSNEHLVAGWALVRCCLIQWWVGGYWWLVGWWLSVWTFLPMPDISETRRSFLGSTSQSIAWWVGIHFLFGGSPAHWCGKDVWFVSIRPEDVSQLHRCPSLLFRSNSLNLRKSDCQRVCLFFLPLTVGFFEMRLYWGAMTVKNPLRAYFLGGIGGVGCWIHVNLLTPLGSKTRTSVRWWCPGSTTLSVLCFWCFSRTSLESCRSFGVLHGVVLGFFDNFVPRSDCAGRKGKGMISIPSMSLQKLAKQGLLLMAACTYFFRSGHLEGMDWILPLDGLIDGFCCFCRFTSTVHAEYE